MTHELLVGRLASTTTCQEFSLRSIKTRRTHSTRVSCGRRMHPTRVSRRALSQFPSRQIFSSGVARSRSEAAGIYSDLQRGFIKVEIVSCEDLVAAGSMPQGPCPGNDPAGGPGITGWPAGDVVNVRFTVRAHALRRETLSFPAVRTEPLRFREFRAVHATASRATLRAVNIQPVG